MVGTVIAVHADRGFGFLHSKESDRDIFFHCYDLAPDLEFGEALQGMRCRFETVEATKGVRAVNVRKAD